MRYGGWEIGDCAQPPPTNPQSTIPNPQSPKILYKNN